MGKKMSASVRGKYTLDFKLEAVRLVKGGQSVPVTAKILGMPTRTLGNWEPCPTTNEPKRSLYF